MKGYSLGKPERFPVAGAGLSPWGTISAATLSESPGKAVKNIVTFNDRYAPQVRKKEAIDV